MRNPFLDQFHKLSYKSRLLASWTRVDDNRTERAEASVHLLDEFLGRSRIAERLDEMQEHGIESLACDTKFTMGTAEASTPVAFGPVECDGEVGAEVRSEGFEVHAGKPGSKKLIAKDALVEIIRHPRDDGLPADLVVQLHLNL